LKLVLGVTVTLCRNIVKVRRDGDDAMTRSTHIGQWPIKLPPRIVEGRLSDEDVSLFADLLLTQGVSDTLHHSRHYTEIVRQWNKRRHLIPNTVLRGRRRMYVVE